MSADELKEPSTLVFTISHGLSADGRPPRIAAEIHATSRVGPCAALSCQHDDAQACDDQHRLLSGATTAILQLAHPGSAPNELGRGSLPGHNLFKGRGMSDRFIYCKQRRAPVVYLGLSIDGNLLSES